MRRAKPTKKWKPGQIRYRGAYIKVSQDGMGRDMVEWAGLTFMFSELSTEREYTTPYISVNDKKGNRSGWLLPKEVPDVFLKAWKKRMKS